MKTKYLSILGLVLLISLGIFYMNKDVTGESVNSEIEGKIVLFKTNQGDFKVKLYEDMPLTSGNFEKLIREGFYDGIIFHRIVEGFVIQGGDPTGTGMGGPGYTIEDEFGENNRNDKYTISMANAGPNTGGSQFFINLDNNNFLDSKHPVFGEVIEGKEIIDKIGNMVTDYNDRPLEDVVMIEVKII